MKFTPKLYLLGVFVLASSASGSTDINCTEQTQPRYVREHNTCTDITCKDFLNDLLQDTDYMPNKIAEKFNNLDRQPLSPGEITAIYFQTKFFGRNDAIYKAIEALPEGSGLPKAVLEYNITKFTNGYGRMLGHPDPRSTDYLKNLFQNTEFGPDTMAAKIVSHASQALTQDEIANIYFQANFFSYKDICTSIEALPEGSGLPTAMLEYIKFKNDREREIEESRGRLIPKGHLITYIEF